MSNTNGPNPMGWDATGWIVFLTIVFGGGFIVSGGDLGGLLTDAGHGFLLALQEVLS